MNGTFSMRWFLDSMHRWVINARPVYCGQCDATPCRQAPFNRYRAHWRRLKRRKLKVSRKQQQRARSYRGELLSRGIMPPLF